MTAKSTADATNSRTVLLVTTFFPPQGGPGVQRNVKFTKYLPRFGWAPAVLTIKPTLYTVEDPTLLDEIPAQTTIRRAGTLDPARLARLARTAAVQLRRFLNRGLGEDAVGTMEGKQAGRSEQNPLFRLYKLVQRWLMVPDSGVCWLPFAIPAGIALAVRTKAAVIVGSCPGPSSLIAAFAIGRLVRRPVVFDFRDGWTDYPYLTSPTGIHRRIHQVLEAFVIPRANVLIVFGPYLKDRLQARFDIPDRSFEIISNGYDPDDFDRIPIVDFPDDKVHLVHSGNMMAYRLAPFTTLAQGLALLPADRRERLTIDLVGNLHPEVMAIARSHGVENVFREWGYLPHLDSLGLVASCSGALILLPAHDEAAVTGKIFEYIGAGLHTIALCSRTSGCGKIVESLGRPSQTVDPTDPAAVAKALLSFLDKPSPVPLASREQYRRDQQARTLARRLDEIAGLPR